MQKAGTTPLRPAYPVQGLKHTLHAAHSSRYTRPEGCPHSRSSLLRATPRIGDLQVVKVLEPEQEATESMVAAFHDTSTAEAVSDDGDVNSRAIVVTAATTTFPVLDSDELPTPTLNEHADTEDPAAMAAAAMAALLDSTMSSAMDIPQPATSSTNPLFKPGAAVHAATSCAPEVDLPLAALSRHSNGPTAPSLRSFPPPVDMQRLQEALLGEPSIGPIFDNLFILSRQRSHEAHSNSMDPASAGPLLYRPRFPRPLGEAPAASLPLLVYLPGIDGTGLAAYRQFPGLAARFDLRGVFLPPEDRTPFSGLVESLAHQIEAEVAPMDPSRPVYLLGESFGGLLALALGTRLSCVDRLLLVNPATSFDRSPWPSLGPLLSALPPDLYRLLPVALSPILSNPFAMAAWNISPSDPLSLQAADMLTGLVELLPQLSSLRVVLPPATLSWRLQLLQEGAREVNKALGKVRQRTLLVVGENDLVIPSASEAPRLAAALPRCRSRVIPGGSHALLQEASMDLSLLIQQEDFYIARRNLTRPNTHTHKTQPLTQPPSPLATAPATSAHPQPRVKPAPGGAAFGTAGPLEIPTPGELKRAVEDAGLSGLRRLVSPVFFSTESGSGRRQLGLGALPAVGSGPVLFVGNHQLFAPDMPLMVEEFLRERGQLLRGLAHPVALGLAAGGVQIGSPFSFPSRSDDTARGPLPSGDGGGGGGTGASRFGRFLETFGAVPVSGRNLYELLKGGEAALLYPGGVREALKLRGEQYELIWPRRAEFVRMACKLGATIVPFAAIGAEDCAEVLLDRRDMAAAPVLGDWLRRQEKGLALARRGVSVSEDVEESFISPLVAPKPPARFYFLLAAPIRTEARVAEDRAAVSELYGRVRSEVEDSLGYLLRKRDQDPYRELLPRLLYEASWGGRRQAPTFIP